jgi:hypothetical protein
MVAPDGRQASGIRVDAGSEFRRAVTRGDVYRYRLDLS